MAALKPFSVGDKNTSLPRMAALHALFARPECDKIPQQRGGISCIVSTTVSRGTAGLKARVSAVRASTTVLMASEQKGVMEGSASDSAARAAARFDDLQQQARHPTVVP